MRLQTLEVIKSTHGDKTYIPQSVDIELMTEDEQNAPQSQHRIREGLPRDSSGKHTLAAMRAPTTSADSAAAGGTEPSQCGLP